MLQNTSITAILARIEELRSSVSIFGKIFKPENYKKVQMCISQELEAKAQCQREVDTLNNKLDEEKQTEKSLQTKISSLIKEISDAIKELEKLYSRRESIKSEGQKLEREFDAVKKEEENQRNLLEKERENYQNQDSYERGFILDRQFISDILSDDQKVSTNAQLQNPWFSEHYNREREKLFLYALHMTKRFILSSKKCRNNFQHLYCLWSGNYCDDKKSVKFIGDDLQNCTAAAYETLFFTNSSYFINLCFCSETFGKCKRGEYYRNTDNR